MAKDFSASFYASKTWDTARENALIRDDFLCQRCLRNGDIKSATMVHHIIELTPENIYDPDISTGLDNLVSLCDLCHKKTHGWAREGSTREGLAFDSDGNLICLDDKERHAFHRKADETQGLEPASAARDGLAFDDNGNLICLGSDENARQANL